MKNKFIIFCCFLAYQTPIFASEGTVRYECLEIRCLKDILDADTVTIYQCVHIYEKDSLIQGMEKLGMLHFKRIEYFGNQRKKFPNYSKKIKELKELYFIGHNLKSLPSFICYDSISYLMIEAVNYKIDFDLLKCRSLNHLALYCKDTYKNLDKICQLPNLDELYMEDKAKKSLKELGCLKELKKLKYLSLCIKLDKLSELSVFTSLKILSINTKISYNVVMKNLNLFKTLDRVYLDDFVGTKEQQAYLKKELKGIWF